MSYGEHNGVETTVPGGVRRINALGDPMDNPVETKKTIQSQVSRIYGSLMECRRHHEEIAEHMQGIGDSDKENEPQNFMELLEVVALLAEKEESNMRSLKDMLF